MHEALFYKKLENQKVRCELCHNHCLILPGKIGACRVRQNIDGKLFSLVYGKPIAINIDPMEKKPLFHFFPGTKIFSLATVGCNFHCLFCQNWQISQPLDIPKEAIIEKTSPANIIKLVKESKCQSIAYTYVEPTIFYEYMYDIAKLAKKEGIKNVYVTNGYIETKPLKKLATIMDAANVDLKSFSDDFYQKICGARLEPVLKNLKLMKKLGIFVEITTLVIPGKNDDTENLKAIAKFIKKELGAKTPWHVSAFYPTYKMLDVPSTQAEKLLKAREIGLKAGLKFVYIGNIPGGDGENTFCPKCKTINIERFGFNIKRQDNHGKCRQCKAKLNIVE